MRVVVARALVIKATMPLKDIVDTSFVEAAVKALGD